MLFSFPQVQTSKFRYPQFDKKLFLICNSESIAESQAQAQQIEAYRQQLSQYQSVWSTQVTMNRR